MMIGRLRGVIVWRGTDQVILEVGGVGYQVQVSERTRAALPGNGEQALLWTEMIVREDAISLVGFLSMNEREWYRLLTSVQGVGAKAALGILGTLGTEGTQRAIALGDAAAVRRAPGVGPKLAQRITMELKDKAPALMAMGGLDDMPLIEPVEATETPIPAAKPRAPKAETAARNARAKAQADALSALSNLGYAASEAAAACAEAADGLEDATNTAALIRAALRLLAPKA